MRDDNIAFRLQDQSLKRDRQNLVRVCLIVASFCLLDTATAQTEIHKCTGEDGGIVYSQLPCTPKKPVEPEKTEADEKADIVRPVAAKPELPVTEHSQEEPKSEVSPTPCKKQYRDAIDAIDAEIRREYSREKDNQYKQRLLVLTRKLRQCP